MSLFDSMREMSGMIPDIESQQQEQMYYDPTAFANEFSAYKAEPNLYPHATQWVSPYASDNWGGVTGIIASFDESQRSAGAIIENKIDPNKIYTAELAALRAAAADQVRITKLFEKKLMEGLKDKDKFGLNENDIMAMQSLTAARSATTSITKEMIGIKKNISELRLKQQQQMQIRGQQVSPDGSPSPQQQLDSGHSVLDDIFDKLPAGVSIDYSGYDAPTESDLDRASQMLDDVVPKSQESMYEAQNPTTYVQIGDTDDDLEFVTYSESGELLENYPNPTTNIIELDKQTGLAKDDTLRTYPILSKK